MKLFSIRSIFFAMLIAMSMLVSCQQTQEEVAPETSKSSTKKNKNAKSLSERLAENENFKSVVATFTEIRKNITSTIDLLSTSDREEMLNSIKNLSSSSTQLDYLNAIRYNENLFNNQMNKIGNEWNKVLVTFPELKTLSSNEFDEIIKDATPVEVSERACEELFTGCMDLAKSIRNYGGGTIKYISDVMHCAADYAGCIKTTTGFIR